MTGLKILLADDHPIFRKGLKEILSDIGDIESITEAADGMEAYHKILSTQPDIAILDLQMPHLTGLNVAQKILSEKNSTKFIILTMHKEKQYYEEAMSIGVSGYLLKDNAILEIISALVAVSNGKEYIGSGIDSLIGTESINPAKELLKELSPTEKIVVKLISENKSTSEIAKLLFISPNTVENHRSNIIKKLKIEGKNALLQFSLEHKTLL